MKRTIPWRAPVLTAFGLLFVLSAYHVGNGVFSAYKEEAAFADLAGVVSAHRGSDRADVRSPYLFLKEENRDFWGWLSIPGTKLDYPVMYTPDEPEYYLNRAFDRSSSLSGTPFVGAGYHEDSGHTIIYGHNMKNGTMFAPLLSYSSKEFWEEHPAITLDFLDESRNYQILGAFYSEAFMPTETNVFRFYQCSDLSTRESFEAYVAQVRDAALYDTGVAAEYGGELLTLATCSYHTVNGRFAVVAYCAESAGGG